MWGRFGSKIKHPSRHQSPEDGDIGNDDGYVVFNVVDAVVDRVCPIWLILCEESVTICKVDFGGTDSRNPEHSVREGT